MDVAKWERHWKDFIEQHAMAIDEKRATVTLTTFNKLDDYSCTLPSGAILGKVWKRHEPFGSPGTWILGQYTEHADPEKLRITWRDLYVLHPLTGEPEVATDDNIDAMNASKKSVEALR